MMNTEDNNSVTIDVIIHAPVERVWKAWTDPVAVSGWFGSDPAGKVLNAKLDVRVGGKFEVTFRDSDQTEHTCSGMYTEVHEFSTLKFTWSWRSEPGVESAVTVALKPDKSFTRMYFQHAGVGMASQHNYLQGWKATFLKLERMLTASAERNAHSN